MSEMDYQRRVERERRDAAYRSAVASVCASMAAFNMTSAIFQKDPGFAAKCGADAIRWQYNIALAHAGLPLLEPGQ